MRSDQMLGRRCEGRRLMGETAGVLEVGPRVGAGRR